MPLAGGLDVAAWILSYLVFAWLRFDTDSVSVPWVDVIAVGAGTAVLYLGLAASVRLHQGRARVASLEEMLLLGLCVASAGGLVALANLFAHWVPRTVPAGATMLALVMMAYARASWRRFNEYDDERFADDGSTRVLVVGAGEAGRELISSMLRDPQRQWRPV
ncbi:MAG: polysaccharide biosynthesis protein, partial [Nocardioides sp.]|nr:polysaccharide biosynthesis protein [Nocardioides sp.]